MGILLTSLGIVLLSHSLAVSMSPSLMAFKRLALAVLLTALLWQLSQA